MIKVIHNCTKCVHGDVCRYMDTFKTAQETLKSCMFSYPKDTNGTVGTVRYSEDQHVHLSVRCQHFAGREATEE